MSEKINFDEESVKEYLDQAIGIARDMNDPVMSRHYTDAYQNVRMSLFGELKE